MATKVNTLDDLIAAVNVLSMKLSVTEAALYRAVQELGPESRANIRRDLPASVDRLMQVHSGHLTEAMDRQMTLSLNAILEACGPPRPEPS